MSIGFHSSVAPVQLPLLPPDTCSFPYSIPAHILYVRPAAICP
nr:MAG TPA: hypothetical protein [Caudoviricetes sp.]